ncbi:MAG: HD domain-containing protein [Clostridia bacterium]|nr:HD domain-containing protein [Clostridia bacterium]
MEKEKIEKNKNEFLEIVKNNITRTGIDEFIAWLIKTDFFEAPASSKFHSAEAGGLCEHSIKVYKRLLSLATAEWGEENINKESIAIIALFHDICKCYYYKVEMRNVKENGEWVQKPYYKVDDQLPYGHGEKSVYIINGYMRLTREEALAINWHMGAYDMRVKAGDQSYANVYYKYPICLLTHLADVMASYLDESRPE